MSNQLTTLRMDEKFKKTPVGEIPVDWGAEQLRTLVNMYSGGTPARVNREYFGGQIPWVKSGELNAGVITNTEETITDVGLENSSAKWVPENTILVALYGATSGQVAMLRIRATINQAILAVLPIGNNLNNEFLFHVLRAHTYKLVSITQGSGQPNLNQDVVSSLVIPLPPITEQKKIAEILSVVDEAIEKTDAVIEKTKELKNGLMQQLLIQGKKKRGWEVRSLGALCVGSPEYGATAPGREYKEGMPRYIRITDIADDGSLRVDNFKGITVEEAKPYMLGEGDFLFARSGATVGKTYLYRKDDGICAFAGYLIRFRPDPQKLLPEYLFQFAHSEPYYQWVKGMLRAGAQPNINASEYAELQLPVPPLHEQRKIIEILLGMDDAVLREIRQRNLFLAISKGLMQALLTGKVRSVNV